MQVAVDGIFDSMEGLPDFQFSVFNEFCNLETALGNDWPMPDDMFLNPGPPCLQRNCLAPDEPGGFEPIALDIPLDFENQMAATASQDYRLQTVLAASYKRPEGKELTELLLGTVIFQSVRAFIVGVCAAGTLLHYLSGEDQSPNPVVKCQSSAEIMSFARFVANARSQVLEPLLLRYQALQPIHLALSTCLALLQSGWICSIRGVEQYTMAVAKVLSAVLGNDVICAAFITQLVQRCSSAASEIEPEFRCDRPGNDVPVDDLTHIQNRVAHETSDGSTQRLSTHSVSDYNQPMSLTSELRITSHSSAPGSAAESRHSSSTPSSASFTPLSVPNNSPSAQPQFCICKVDGCNKQYNGPDAPSNLRRHKREKHDGKRFACPFDGCPHTSPRRSNLKTHWKRHHRGVEMPHCLTS
ncbi:hypothetical protein BJY00DRAFT_285405, partial [Aspergillus carlsbadensis]